MITGGVINGVDRIEKFPAPDCSEVAVGPLGPPFDRRSKKNWSPITNCGGPAVPGLPHRIPDYLFPVFFSHRRRYRNRYRNRFTPLDTDTDPDMIPPCRGYPDW
jgi:hypothetical protein